MSTKIFYRPEYTSAGASFDTTRKSAWIAESLQNDPIARTELVPPALLTEAQLLEVHSPVYVNAIKTGEPAGLASSAGFFWDEGMWTAVRASNGGAVEAALAALQDGAAGSLSSGLHHARRDTGAGFCTFNGLALAAKAALHARVKSILLIDLDAHCGGGTFSILKDEPSIRILDISSNHGDGYKPNERATLDVITDASRYLPTLRQRLEEVSSLSFDLCLYNAGMDLYEGCSIGGLAGMDVAQIAAREREVFSWCRKRSLPVAFVLAGGYVGSRLSHERLVALHRLTIQEAAAR
jgi:acetoin utilization deacetylase AcuC-like enzyme